MRRQGLSRPMRLYSGGLRRLALRSLPRPSPRYYAGATLGATLGYLMSFHMMTNVKYIVAMALLFGLRVMLGFPER